MVFSNHLFFKSILRETCDSQITKQALYAIKQYKILLMKKQRDHLHVTSTR